MNEGGWHLCNAATDQTILVEYSAPTGKPTTAAGQCGTRNRDLLGRIEKYGPVKEQAALPLTTGEGLPCRR